jgi:hypothetical protein
MGSTHAPIISRLISGHGEDFAYIKQVIVRRIPNEESRYCIDWTAIISLATRAEGDVLVKRRGVHSRSKSNAHLVKIVSRFNTISIVAVCDGGKTYQLCLQRVSNCSNVDMVMGENGIPAQQSVRQRSHCAEYNPRRVTNRTNRRTRGTDISHNSFPIKYGHENVASSQIMSMIPQLEGYCILALQPFLGILKSHTIAHGSFNH